MTFQAAGPAFADFIVHTKPLNPSALLRLPAVVGGLPDATDGGDFEVLGTTRVKGTPDAPVRRRVRLHDQLSGRVVREVWSQEGTGAYHFHNLRPGIFYLASFDHTRTFNGVIATDVASEPMP